MLTPRQRFHVLQRDQFTCQYCGQRAPYVELEVDHVNPQCRGGGDDFENLVAACSTCNRGKAGLPLGPVGDRYRRIIDEIPSLVASILAHTRKQPDAALALRAVGLRSQSLNAFLGEAWGLLGALDNDCDITSFFETPVPKPTTPEVA